jgi:hypothetical protein
VIPRLLSGHQGLNRRGPAWARAERPAGPAGPADPAGPAGATKEEQLGQVAVGAGGASGITIPPRAVITPMFMAEPFAQDRTAKSGVNGGNDT